MSRPSLLASANEEIDSLKIESRIMESTTGVTQEPGKGTQNRRTRCNCKARYRDSSNREALSIWRYGRFLGHKWRYQSGIFSTESHDLTCPLYPDSPAVITVRLSMRICGALLKDAAEASFSIIRGAGGFSISPMLHCQRIVDEQEGAFGLVKSYWVEIKFAKSAKDLEDTTTRKIQEIKQLFQKRQATPYDVDIRGRTLLHVSSRH